MSCLWRCRCNPPPLRSQTTPVARSIPHRLYFYCLSGAPALKGTLSGKIACIFPHWSVDRWTLTVAFPLWSFAPPPPPPHGYLPSAFLWHSSLSGCFVGVQRRLLELAPQWKTWLLTRRVSILIPSTKSRRWIFSSTSFGATWSSTPYSRSPPPPAPPALQQLRLPLSSCPTRPVLLPPAATFIRPFLQTLALIYPCIVVIGIAWPRLL